MSQPPAGPHRVESSDSGSRERGTRSLFADLPAAPPELDLLLLALRAEKIPVGIGELTWLHHAFALNPRLDREQVRTLLACTLVKDPARHPDFDALFDDWWPPERAPEGTTDGEETAGDTSAPTPPNPHPPHRRRDRPAGEKTIEAQQAPESWLERLAAILSRLSERAVAGGRELLARIRGFARQPVFWLGMVLLVGLLAAGLFGWRFLESEAPAPPPPGPGETEKPQETSSGLRTVRAAPPPGAEPFVPANTGARWSGIGLGLIALVMAGLASRRYRRQRQLPAPVPLAEGPAWLPRLKLETGGPELLDGDQLRTLIWGIGRFVSEDLTEKVDAAQTVAATARAGGIPELRYRHAVYPREVWLWQDASTQDPAVQRLADELETGLERAGLPVRRGWFADVPELVRWSQGQEFAPAIVEGHRQSAMVAVLTDGAGLAMTAQSALTRGSLAALLRCLGDWPRLAFVDFGRDRHGLAERLRPYRLACIAPDALAAFLGEGQVYSAPASYTDPGLAGELRAWAAATALSEHPLDPDTAYALRRSLKLGVSPFGFEQLIKNGEDRAGRLAWPDNRRVELLDWLARAEALDSSSKVPVDSLLGRALAFWRGRLDEERERRRKAESRLHPWSGTKAEQRLNLERALLDLWTQPAAAAKALYRLHRGAFGEEVRGRLATYAPRDWPAIPGRVRLPWRWADQPERIRWLYGKMGFGGKGALAPPPDLRPSATLGASLGLCLGLLAAAVFVALRPPLLERWTDSKSGIVFVRIPGGTFQMGSPETETDADEDERPQHQVRLGPFWMARTETTNAQYRRLNPEHEGPDELPAAPVSWDKAKAFCEHYGFHLPTEAQWEYAARAGTTTRWSFGDEEALLGRHAWYAENADDTAHQVATKAPNPWGLHDMHGNLWEWIEDCYDEKAYGGRRSGVEEPLVTGDQCQYRVVRGGSAWGGPWGLRSAFRGGRVPEDLRDYLGFRCVRVPGRQLGPLTF